MFEFVWARCRSASLGFARRRFESLVVACGSFAALLDAVWCSRVLYVAWRRFAALRGAWRNLQCSGSLYIAWRTGNLRVLVRACKTLRNRALTNSGSLEGASGRFQSLSVASGGFQNFAELDELGALAILVPPPNK